MPVVRCPGCDRQLNVPDTARRVQCPQCGRAFDTGAEGIVAGSPKAAGLVTAAAPERSASPKGDGQRAERGNEMLLVIGLSIVAAVILFAVVGGVGFYFFAVSDEFIMVDEAPVPEVMIAPVEMIDEDIEVKIEPVAPEKPAP